MCDIPFKVAQNVSELISWVGIVTEIDSFLEHLAYITLYSVAMITLLIILFYSTANWTGLRANVCFNRKEHQNYSNRSEIRSLLTQADDAVTVTVRLVKEQYILPTCQLTASFARVSMDFGTI